MLVWMALFDKKNARFALAIEAEQSQIEEERVKKHLETVVRALLKNLFQSKSWDECGWDSKLH